MKHVPPGLPGSIVSAEPRYENFIGGKWLAPTRGNYHVAPGEPENFSLPAAGNPHFVTRSPTASRRVHPAKVSFSSTPEWSTP
jgi:hypothetical protein